MAQESSLVKSKQKRAKVIVSYYIAAKSKYLPFVVILSLLSLGKLSFFCFVFL